MKRFRIKGWETIRFDHIVEAESLEDAQDWIFFVDPDFKDEERFDGIIDEIEEVTEGRN